MLPEVTGVYTNLTTRNLILQDRGAEGLEESEERLFDVAPSVLEARIAQEYPDRQIPPNFRFSREYYEKIKDEKERMRAYRSLVVSSQILDGVDAEIEENPWKFLYIPKDSDVGYLRTARIRLSQIWHPDTMDPKNREKLETVFKFSPQEFPIKGKTYSEWLQDLDASRPKSLESAFESASRAGALSAAELAHMDPEDREEYLLFHEERQRLEEEAITIRQKMIEIATEKMIIINKAVQAANKRLGIEGIRSFGGYNWQETSHMPWLSGIDSSFDQMLIKFGTARYSDLPLEGNGVIRRKSENHYRDRLLNMEAQQPTLTFDFGDVYLMEEGYRQDLNIRALFAWIELRMGNELAPSLLDGVVEMYNLSHHQRERLRLMLMNKESENFVLETLEIKNEVDAFPLKRFVWAVEEGPRFYHYHGPTRTTSEYPLGVEFTSQGELILKYVHQSDQSFGWDVDWDEEARFTASDVDLMRAIAYGPLLPD